MRPQFRPQAVNRHIDTDLAGGLLRSAPRWTTVLWAAAGIITLGALSFAVVGRVDVNADGRGIVRPENGPTIVRAPRAGHAGRAIARIGDTLGSGGQVMELQADDGDNVTVVAPAAGTLSEMLVDPGMPVQAGDPLFTFIPANAKLVGYVAMPERDRAALLTGKPMRLRVDAFPDQDFGSGEATIRRVSPDLVGARWADQLHNAGIDPTGMLLVEVSLDKPPPRTAPGTTYQPGMLFSGAVVLRRQRIAALAFRPLGDVLGD